MNNTQNLTREDKIVTLQDALEKLAEAEELVRSLNDAYLNAYVADHIDAQGRMLGKGLAGLLEEKLNELNAEGAEEVTELMKGANND